MRISARADGRITSGRIDTRPAVGQRARRLGHRFGSAAAPVENDEIISKAVHFQKIRRGLPNTPKPGE